MTEMMEFFRKTGAAGGRKRAANMTQEQRSESARQAVMARWAKKKRAGSRKAAAKARKEK